MKHSFPSNLANGVASSEKDFGNMCMVKLKHSIGGIERLDGTLSCDESEMAEVLNNFFSSVFTNEKLLNVPSMGLNVQENPCHVFIYPWHGVCLEAAM